MRNRQWDTDAEINITPLIDILFILLLFFILTSTFEIFQEQAIEITLPQAQTGQAITAEARWIVSVSANNDLSLAGQPITLEQLERRLVEDINRDMVLDPSIFADEKAHHGIVVQVLDLFRRNGIHHVQIEVRIERP